MRLLLLEDDDVLGDALSGFLRCEGHHVDWFTRLDQVSGLADEPYDALLIDWQLPDGSGVAWVAALRRRGNTTPILVLSARDLLADRIVGLDSGADDYLVKPFAPAEFLARIRALLRRKDPAGAGDQPLTFADLHLDPVTRETLRGDRRFELTPKEFELLAFLMRHPRQVVQRERLLEEVWGYDPTASFEADLRTG